MLFVNCWEPMLNALCYNVLLLGSQKRTNDFQKQLEDTIENAWQELM